MTNEIRNRL